MQAERADKNAADYSRMQAKSAKYREALSDFVENGLRFNLNPTQFIESWELVTAFLKYIKRMDESVRERARRALKGEQEYWDVKTPDQIVEAIKEICNEMARKSDLIDWESHQRIFAELCRYNGITDENIDEINKIVIQSPK